MEETKALQYGHDIRDIRIRTGLSQKEFAKLLHCPLRTLKNWETGTEEIPLYELYWLKAFKNQEEEDLRVMLKKNPEFAGLDLKAGWKKYLDLYFD